MPRPQILVLVLVGLFFILGSTSAQTLDDVLAKHYEARGGVEKLKGIQTISLKGKIMSQGMELQVDVRRKRPNLSRTDINIQGQQLVQVYDGNKAWMINPMMGSTEPQDMPAQQGMTMKEQSDIDGYLINWKEKEYKLELLGKEEVEGADAYHVKVTTKDNLIRHIYLEADSYLEIRSKTTFNMGGQDIEVISSMGDYKKVDDLMIPFSIEQRRGQQLISQFVIEKVEFNKQLSDSLFVRPITKKEK